MTKPKFDRDFWAHRIYPEVEFISPNYVNTALERLERGESPATC